MPDMNNMFPTTLEETSLENNYAVLVCPSGKKALLAIFYQTLDLNPFICCDCIVILFLVGDGEEGYNTIFSAFRNNVIGNYARAIILNPLAPNLPRLPILIMPTCNRFDTDFVHRQW